MPSRNRPAPAGTSTADREARRLAFVVHLAFFLLLGSALVRYVQWHGTQPQVPAVLALAGALALLYVVGRRRAADPEAVAPSSGSSGRPPLAGLLWLGALVGVWTVLVAPGAPSFARCRSSTPRCAPSRRLPRTHW
jgi:hypothetical protein